MMSFNPYNIFRTMWRSVTSLFLYVLCLYTFSSGYEAIHYTYQINQNFLFRHLPLAVVSAGGRNIVFCNKICFINEVKNDDALFSMEYLFLQYRNKVFVSNL